MTCTGIQDEVQWPPRSALNLDLDDLGGGAGTAGIALGTGHNSAVPLNDRWNRFQNALIFRWLPFARPIQVSSCPIMYSIIMYYHYLDCSLHQTPRSRKNTSFNLISVTLMYLQVSLFRTAIYWCGKWRQSHIIPNCLIKGVRPFPCFATSKCPALAGSWQAFAAWLCSADGWWLLNTGAALRDWKQTSENRSRINAVNTC